AIVISMFRECSMAAPRDDPGGDGAHLVVAQSLTPARHDAVAAVTHGGGDAGEVAAIEPDVVGEIGCAERGIAACIDTMAGGAQCLEARFTGGNPVFRRLDPTEAQHI